MPSRPEDELLDRLAIEDCNSTRKALESLWQLEESHRLIENRKQLGTDEESKSSYGEGGAASLGGVRATRPKTPAAAEVRRQLYTTTKALCRQIRDDKLATKVLNSWTESHSQPESEGMSIVVENFERLQEIIKVKLSTTVEEEHTRQAVVQELKRRTRESTEDHSLLQEKMMLEKSEKEQVISELDATLVKLRAELDAIKQNTSIETTGIKRESGNALTASTEQHEANMKELNERLKK